MFERASSRRFVCFQFSGLLALFLVTMTILTSHSAQAGEPLFGYLYTTDLLPQNHWEVEQWFTDRHGQAGGSFDHLDMSTEVEYGVTDKFQIAVYANYMYANESANSVRGLTEGIEIPYNHNPDRPYNTGRFDGFSIEAMYRVLSPYTDPVGLAFYIEPEIGSFETGLEIRAIVQKNWIDDKLVFAGNLWVEFDREHSSNLVTPGSDDVPDGAISPATYAEVDLGLSYRFATGWYGGLEFRNHNEYQGYTLAHSAQDHTAFFVGPNIHYASEKWFATLSVLKQVLAIAYTDDQKAELKNGLLYGDEHTTFDGIRLIVGFPL